MKYIRILATVSFYDFLRKNMSLFPVCFPLIPELTQTVWRMMSHLNYLLRILYIYVSMKQVPGYPSPCVSHSHETYGLKRCLADTTEFSCS
jgi:hypothetical protein